MREKVSNVLQIKVVSLLSDMAFKDSSGENPYLETEVRVLIGHSVGVADLEDDSEAFLLNRFPDVLGRIRTLHVLALRERDTQVSALADTRGNKRIDRYRTYCQRLRNRGKAVVQGTNENHVALPDTAAVSSLIFFFIVTL